MRVARALGVDVRVEPFETPPAGGGGRCVVDGRELVLLDARATPAARVETLARVLASLDVERVYMAPGARELVDAMRTAQAAPAEHVPLAPLCTLRVRGRARFFVEARDEAAVLGAVDWAAGRGVPLLVLGGGSNLVVADGGVDGARRARRAPRCRGAARRGRRSKLTAAAGEPWDALVRHAVERGWAGLECLSGHPGPGRGDADPERGRLRPGGE